MLIVKLRQFYCVDFISEEKQANSVFEVKTGFTLVVIAFTTAFFFSFSFSKLAELKYVQRKQERSFAVG